VAQQNLTSAIEECNKYDLTAAPCFRFANHNDWFRWFAMCSVPPLCNPSFSFECVGLVAKK